MIALALCLAAAAQEDPGSIFDFERENDLAAWSSAAPWTPSKVADTTKFERSIQHASSGKHSLKITYGGGVDWPVLEARTIPSSLNLKDIRTVAAEVTVDRQVFAAIKIGRSGRAMLTTLALQPGTNPVRCAFDGEGAVTSFQISIFRPLKDETVHWDNIRLSPTPRVTEDRGYFSPYFKDGGYSMAAQLDLEKTKSLPEFKVAGTPWTVPARQGDMIRGLYEQVKATIPKGRSLTVADAEAEFQKTYADLKVAHPKAVLATFRDGESIVPGGPVFSGWRDTYLTSHSPDGPNEWRTRSEGKSPSLELFMRHRSILMKVDLSAIPKKATVLAARLLLSRTTPRAKFPPALFVAEPCNRPWEETEANCYEYARGKHWKAVSGQYAGADPDFHPLYAGYGTMGNPTGTFEFTEAVRLWTGGAAENHGFFMHGMGEYYPTDGSQPGDRLDIRSREWPDVKDRPALLVIYDPASKRSD